MSFPHAHETTGDIDPMDPDGLIGRDADIAWVVARIERGEPLVVVSGPAGVGKTSLATRLARIVERPGRHVIGPTDLRSALRAVAASRPRLDAAIGAIDPQGVLGPVAEALQAQADVRTDTSLIVLIDDYESSPRTQDVLSKLLVATGDPSRQTIVLITRSTEAPFGAAIHRIEALPVEVLVEHLARVGELLDPPASPKELEAWVSHLSSDISLAADLFRALRTVRSVRHDTGVR